MPLVTVRVPSAADDRGTITSWDACRPAWICIVVGTLSPPDVRTRTVPDVVAPMTVTVAATALAPAGIPAFPAMCGYIEPPAGTAPLRLPSVPFRVSTTRTALRGSGTYAPPDVELPPV